MELPNEDTNPALFKPEFNSVAQVGATPENNSVSPLSLWERVRVRGLLRAPRYLP